MRALIVLLFVVLALPTATSYLFVPSQPDTLLQVWTAEQTHTTRSTQEVTQEGVIFVALDGDGDSVFDRGGIPDGDIVVLYPVGLVRGSLPGAAELTISCQHPSIESYTVDTNFMLPLPAGDCIITATDEQGSIESRLSVTANDVTDVIFELQEQRSVGVYIVLALALAVILGYLVLRKRRAHMPDELLRLLSADERRVLEYVQTRGPQLAGVVRKDLEIPKTSFHRIKRKLLEKELISEEEYGNTTRIAWNESTHPN